MLAQPMVRPMLKLEDVTAFYGPIRVIDGVSLEVGEQEIVALLGTNGAGKSTILKAISGIVPVRSGRISFMGQDLTNKPPERVVRAGIGHVPGGRGLLAGLTVDENLRLGGQLVTSKRLGSAIDSACEAFPWMRERRRQLAGTLSGGEQQMLAIARALVGSPRLLMVDELSLGLAPAIVEELIRLLADLVAEREMSIILVEQHVTFALSVASRAYFLERGRVRFEGDSSELAGRSDLLRSVFLTGASEEVGVIAGTSSLGSERLFNEDSSRLSPSELHQGRSGQR